MHGRGSKAQKFERLLLRSCLISQFIVQACKFDVLRLVETVLIAMDQVFVFSQELKQCSISKYAFRQESCVREHFLHATNVRLLPMSFDLFVQCFKPGQPSAIRPNVDLQRMGGSVN